MQINNSQQQLRVQYSQIMQQGRIESTQGRAPQASPNGSMVAAEHTVSIANQTQSITSQALGKTTGAHQSAVLGHVNLSAAMQSMAVTSSVTLSASPTTNLSQALDTVATRATAPAAELVPPPTNTSDDSEIDESQDEKPFNAMHSFQEVRQILASLQQSWAQRLPARGQDDAIAALSANDEMTPIASVSQEKLLPTQAPLMPPNVTNAPSTSIAQWSYRYQSLDVDFAGSANLADGSSVSWQFSLAVTESRFDLRQAPPPELKDPLVLSLGGGIAAIGQEQVAFDLIAGDAMEHIPKLSGQDYYLAWDQNSNQRIDNGNELFGPSTGQGFTELARFDADNNGFIDSADPAYEHLSLWQPGQSLQSLKNMGIGAISTQAVATPFNYYHEDQLLARLSKSSIYLSQSPTTATATKEQTSAAYRVGLVQQIDVSA